MKYIFPKRIVQSSQIDSISSLLNKDYLQVDIDCGNSIYFKDKDFVIFDFGKEISGGIRLLTSSFDPKGKARIRFGESIGECSSELGEFHSTNDHSPRDFCVTLPFMSDLTFGETGFRFVRLDFFGEYWNIQHIVAAIDIDERKEVGIFKSNDKLLNKIWSTASYTLRLNLHNGLIWDGVKRDRLCWIGDAYNEIESLKCLYKNQEEIKNVLEFCKKSAVNIEDFSNMIPSSYCLWWIIILLEKYIHDGDKNYLNNNKDNILKILTFIDSKIDKNGNVILPFNFVDWPTHPLINVETIKENDEIVGVNSLTLITCNKINETFLKLNDHSFDTIINEIKDKIKQSPNKVLKFKQVAALAYLANSEDEDAYTILTNGGAHGFSTFQSYVILKALAKANKQNESIKIIKEYYGKMLELGATTFFEDFDVDWAINASRIDEITPEGKIDFHATHGQFCYKGYRHSLCHGWSTGVIPYLVEEIVGLKQIDKNTFLLSPCLGELKEIYYVYPLNKNKQNIKIHIINKDGNYEIKVDHPKEVTINIIKGGKK